MSLPDDLRDDPELARLRELVDRHSERSKMSAAAHDRAVRGALAVDASAATPAQDDGLTIQRFLFPAVAGLAAAAAIVLFIVSGDGDRSANRYLELAPGDGAQLGSAEVEAVDETAVLATTEHPEGIMLSAGRVRVQVDRQIRVATPEFVIDAARTELTIDRHSVSVRRGAVAIYATSGELLAPKVVAGEVWTLDDGLQPAPQPEPAATETPPAAAPPVDSAAPPVVANDEPATQPPSSRSTKAASWLTRARRKLAAGDTAGARRAIGRALAASPTRNQRAEAETLRAEVALVQGDKDAAVDRYLAVAERYRKSAAGENALFAAARLAARSGQRQRAVELFARYLRDYPSGRFVREANSWTARLE